MEEVLLEESMVNFLNNYSNGWGHLIMSAFFALIGVALILAPQTDATTKSIGISLLMTVSAAWFIPGAAKQISYNITRQIQASPPASTPPAEPPTPAAGA